MKYWISGHIRLARVTKGFTQTTYGGFINRSQSYISDMENDVFDPPFHEVEALLRKAEQPMPTAPDKKTASGSDDGFDLPTTLHSAAWLCLTYTLYI